MKNEKAKLTEKLFGYLVGPFGAMLASGICASILQTYLTDVLKVELTFLSALQIVSTFIIMIANLVMGQVVEKTKALSGKSRPWILRSAWILSIATVLMFLNPFEGVAKLVWITVAYILFYGFAYPIYNTANSTLVSLSTRDSGDRQTFAFLNNIAQLGSMGVGSMIFPVLVSYVLKEDRKLWLVAFIGIAAFSAIAMFLQYRFTRERVTEELREFSAKEAAGEPKPIEEQKTEQENVKKEEAPDLKTQLSAIAREPYWWIVLAFGILMQWSGAMKNGSMSYFCKWVLDNSIFGSADAWGMSQSILGIMGAIPMAVAAVVVVPIANKIGKRMIVALGMFLGVIGGIIAIAGGDAIVPVAVGVAIKCLGSAPACYLVLAMLADVIDHVEYKTGVRTDGLVMSVYASIIGAGSTVMNALFMKMLDVAGYDRFANVEDGILAQAQAVKNVICFNYIWVETVCYVICGVIVLFWTVEKHLPEEQKEIERRHAA